MGSIEYPLPQNKIGTKVNLIWKVVMIAPLLADYFCKSNHLSFLEPWFFYSHITFSIDDQVLFYLSSKEARIS